MAKRTKTYAQAEAQTNRLVERLNSDYVKGDTSNAQRNQAFGNRLDRVFRASANVRGRMDRVAYRRTVGTKPAGLATRDEMQRFLDYRDNRKFTAAERTGVRSAMGSGR